MPIQAGPDTTVRMETSLILGQAIKLCIAHHRTRHHRRPATLAYHLSLRFRLFTIRIHKSCRSGQAHLGAPTRLRTPLNKLAGSPMPQSLGRLGDSSPVFSSPVAEVLEDRRVLLDIACVGLSFAQQLRWYIEAVQDLIGHNSLGAFIQKIRTSQCVRSACLTLTASPFSTAKGQDDHQLRDTTQNNDSKPGSMINVPCFYVFCSRS